MASAAVDEARSRLEQQRERNAELTEHADALLAEAYPRLARLGRFLLDRTPSSSKLLIVVWLTSGAAFVLSLALDLGVLVWISLVVAWTGIGATFVLLVLESTMGFRYGDLRGAVTLVLRFRGGEPAARELLAEYPRPQPREMQEVPRPCRSSGPSRSTGRRAPFVGRHRTTESSERTWASR